MINDSEPTNNLPQWPHEDIKQKDAKYENIKSYDTSQIRGFSFNHSKLTWIWRKEENHLVMANSDSEDKDKIKVGHQPEVIQLEESRQGKQHFLATRRGSYCWPQKMRRSKHLCQPMQGPTMKKGQLNTGIQQDYWPKGTLPLKVTNQDHITPI